MAGTIENAVLTRTSMSLQVPAFSTRRARINGFLSSEGSSVPSALCLFHNNTRTRNRRCPSVAKSNSVVCRHARSKNVVTCCSAVVSQPGTDIETVFHTLPSTLRLEVLVQRATKSAGTEAGGPPPPPLLFVHGSYHAAWCWQEHWMPFFAAQGHDCFAVSLLGQGESDSPAGPVAGTIQSHARDLSHLISHVIGRAPVMVGHSFGGLIVQAYLSLQYPLEGTPQEDLSPLSGAVLLCSVPPSGNKDLVMRFLVTRPILSIKVTLSLAAKMFATNTGICRDSFFSKDMPESEVKRYQKLMAGSSKMPLFDLRQLNASLPVPKPLSSFIPPLLILGAENDAVLDIPALQETSDFFGTPYAVVPDIAHDVMIDTRWNAAANELLDWLRKNL